MDLDTRVLTHDDIIALLTELVTLPRYCSACPRTRRVEIKGLRRRGRTRPSRSSRRPSTSTNTEHFGTRRLRTVGELIQEALRVRPVPDGARRAGERLTTEDVDTITPQTIVNIRPVVAAQKEFFGSSQLSQFMDQTSSSRGAHAPPEGVGSAPGGLTRERAPYRGARRAPDPLRAHVPDRDAGRSEHRPDSGPLSSFRRGVRLRLRHHAQRVVEDGVATGKLVHLKKQMKCRPGEHAARRQDVQSSRARMFLCPTQPG